MSFQSRVNKLAGCNYLHFTTELWRPVSGDKHEGDATIHLDDEGGEEGNGEISKALWKKVAVWVSKWFSFLDMRMMWQGDRLEIQVDIMKLWPGDTQVDEIYLEHVEALHKAGLAPEDFSTLREICEKDDGRLVEKKKKQRDSRTTYF
eukprot:6322000-Ditylum_brightwellii.AAC.1